MPILKSFIDDRARLPVERLADWGLHLATSPLICREAAIEQGREWQAQYCAPCLIDAPLSDADSPG
jgi:hypothetical protein